MESNRHFVRWFSEIDKSDLLLVGPKATKLGELYSLGIPVLNGFVISSAGFNHFLKTTNLDVKIKHILSTANVNNLRSLHQISLIIKQLISDTSFPDDFVSEIITDYKILGEPAVELTFSKDNQSVISNINGDAVLLDKIKFAWETFFGPKEIFSRKERNILLPGETSIIIQKSIQAEQSGVIFTCDSLDKQLLTIQVNRILGLNQQEPITYKIRKSDLSIIEKPAAQLSEQQILMLSELGLKIENYFYFPQMISWLLVGNKIFIEKTVQMENVNLEKINKPTVNDDLLIKGLPVSKGIASGPVKLVASKQDAQKVTADDIMVIKEIKSFHLDAFKKAAAVVIEDFDKNIQMLFESNELRLPCVANATNASDILKQNQIVTVNASKGEVYKGGLSIMPNKYKPLPENPKTITKLFAKIDQSENSIQNYNDIDGYLALNANKLIVDFGIHPKHLIQSKQEDKLVSNISEHLAKLCKPVAPKPVIYQFSNLTVSQYQLLESGANFETMEQNPEIGLRGAFRFINDPEIFRIELEAVKNVREKNLVNNLWVSIPFVRTFEELSEIKKIILQAGLQRSSEFKIFMTIDVPSNMVELKKFIDLGLDGLLINSTSLLSLLSGTDKTNFEINAEINKYDFSFVWVLEKIVKTASALQIPTILFSEDETNFAQLADSIVQLGIGGICVPESLIGQTKKIIERSEKLFVSQT